MGLELIHVRKRHTGFHYTEPRDDVFTKYFSSILTNVPERQNKNFHFVSVSAVPDMKVI